MRKTLNELLQNYMPHDLWEQQCKERMRMFFNEYFHDCFNRSLSVGHFTVSVWLLNCSQTHVLLMHHAKLNKWTPLGGHCDGNSDVLAVAIKEAQEESGVQEIIPLSEEIFDLDIHVFPAMEQNREHYHYDVRFLLKMIKETPVTKNRESKELRWISKNRQDLPTSDRTIMRMFEKWAAR